MVLVSVTRFGKVFFFLRAKFLAYFGNFLCLIIALYGVILNKIIKPSGQTGGNSDFVDFVLISPI